MGAGQQGPMAAFCSRACLQGNLTLWADTTVHSYSSQFVRQCIVIVPSKGASDPVKIQPHSLRKPTTVTISNNLADAHRGNQVSDD